MLRQQQQPPPPSVRSLRRTRLPPPPSTAASPRISPYLPAGPRLARRGAVRHYASRPPRHIHPRARVTAPAGPSHRTREVSRHRVVTRYAYRADWAECAFVFLERALGWREEAGQRCRRDAAEMQPRCSRDAAEMQPRRDAIETGRDRSRSVEGGRELARRRAGGGRAPLACLLARPTLTALSFRRPQATLETLEREYGDRTVVCGDASP